LRSEFVYVQGFNKFDADLALGGPCYPGWYADIAARNLNFGAGRKHHRIFRTCSDAGQIRQLHLAVAISRPQEGAQKDAAALVSSMFGLHGVKPILSNPPDSRESLFLD